MIGRLGAYRHDPMLEQVLKLDEQLQGYKRGFVTALDLLADLEEAEFVVSLLERERLKDTSLEVFKKDEIDTPEFRSIASAELAKLAHPQACPRLALWRTAEHAYSRSYSGWGHRVGRLVLVALFKELGVTAPSDLTRKDLDDEDFAAALLAALEKPPAELALAAGRAYQAVFGQAAPAFERAPSPTK
jgi:hypothetical protein